MGVIAFPNISPQGSNPQFQWGQRTISVRQKSSLGAGVATTLERPGSEWTARLPYANLVTSRRAKLQAFAMSCRGYANRFYLPLYGWTRRGSFPATELLTNNTFASATGWTAESSFSLGISDGVARLTRNTGYAAGADSMSWAAALAVTQYAPYAARSLDVYGAGSFTSGVQLGSTQAASDYAITTSASGGLRTAVAVLPVATAWFGLVDLQAAPVLAGEYYHVAYTSLARCALVDNGPNALLQSDTMQTTWTPTNATVVTNAQTAPNGTATADELQESGASGVHSISQSFTVSSAAQDIEFSCSIQGSARGFAAVEISATGGSASFYANLTTGVISAAAAAGGNFTNARAFVVAQGNGWYRLTIVARKTGSETTVTCTVYAAAVSGTASYVGSAGATSIYMWRGSASVGSVPTRGGQTVASATTGTAQTGGGIYLKGLPASTSGLLLPGDPAEVIIGTSSQLVRTRAPLNSDAAGLGYFEFEAPIRVSPSDNAAVIIHNPLCRMMLDSPNVEWSEHSGGFSDLEFAAVEDTYP